MRFFKRLMCIVILVLLSACATINLGGGSTDEPDKTDITEATANEQGEESIILIPSPYQAGRVPAQAEVEFNQALTLMRDGKWRQAEAMLLLMTETYPKLSGPYVNLGIIYSKLGRPSEAIKAFQFAIETNPTNMDAYGELGVVLREEGRFNEAEAVYLDALNVWPHDPLANRNLGILYDLYMGKLAPALQRFKLLQKLQAEPDKKLKGWIVDLERRIKKASKAS